MTLGAIQDPCITDLQYIYPFIVLFKVYQESVNTFMKDTEKPLHTYRH
jgi:hypothetical protein